MLSYPRGPIQTATAPTVCRRFAGVAPDPAGRGLQTRPRAIACQSGGNIYRYVQGAPVADPTKPSTYYSQVNCSADGRYVSTSVMGGGTTPNYCSTQDASGKWVTSTRYCRSGACALSQVADQDLRL